jgi:hypothetical protein
MSHHERSKRPLDPPAARAAAVAVIGAYAWWVAARPQFSATTAAVVVGSGAAAIAWGSWRRPRAPRPPARAAVPPGVGSWAALAALLAAWQLAAYFQEPRSRHPTLSVLADALLDPRPVRALAFAAWVAVAAMVASR